MTELALVSRGRYATKFLYVALILWIKVIFYVKCVIGQSPSCINMSRDCDVTIACESAGVRKA